ncbi:hypothetical protein [Pseudomonas fluorescens]|uniref:Uncharacterized protein n=1 Tax=Pseudomonas fluorescens TaxID=294 RepID=A0A5E7AMA7_PSEFL|nr:hypothetical protein [Pseudomonas fluorescens]VVN75743.1 hypothetical protein PS833_00721 [Pseudomonas fluorescens]
MDAKNLAVLMQLKELMSSKDVDELRSTEKSVSTVESRVPPQAPNDRKINRTGSPGRLDERAIYRGVYVGRTHYKALVEAVSSTGTANILQKLEALAFYLEKAPDDMGALKAFDRLSVASTEPARSEPRKRPTAKPSKLCSDIQIRAECCKCHNVYAVSFNSVPPSWECKSCIRLEKLSRQNEAQALVDRQYASGTDNKVRKIEMRIKSLKAILDSGNIENPRGLMIQISQLEKLLKLEKAHAISGFRKIRAHQVHGSYGSSK